MEFHCVTDCSQCCIEREYFPSKKFGKIGVLIMPDEKSRIEGLAQEIGIDVVILPRIGTSDRDDVLPTKTIAYQMMGADENGNTCPFLDTTSGKRSPHGGFACRIYDKRPLACRAYPVIDASTMKLDAKCRFCQECGTADENLTREAESITRIASQMPQDIKTVWRYATGIGEKEDACEIRKGWFHEQTAATYDD